MLYLILLVLSIICIIMSAIIYWLTVNEKSIYEAGENKTLGHGLTLGLAVAAYFLLSSVMALHIRDMKKNNW